MFSQVLDDYLIIVVSVIALVVATSRWRRKSLTQLMKTNNILLVLSIAAVLVALVALVIESGDANEMADDITKLNIWDISRCK